MDALRRTRVPKNRRIVSTVKGGSIERASEANITAIRCRGVGLELCKILDPNFGEFPFHALL